MKRLEISIAVFIVLVQCVAAGLSADNKERQSRERARDRVVHVEQGVIREIPRVPRLCDSLSVRKDRIDVGDCNLYCEQEGRGVSLVLVNGGPGSTHHHFHPWFSQAEDFARIIYYDQRGCGLSDYRPGKGYNVKQAVDDLDHLRQALGIDRWVVLGHSYGGLLAQCYATKYPENLRAIVLVCASMGLQDSSVSSRDHEFISRQEMEKMNEIGRTPGLSISQIVYNNFLNGDWKRQSYYKPSRERISQIALYECVCDDHFSSIMSSSADSVDLEGAFARCPIPTLIMEGTWDMSWGPEKPPRLRKNHPGSRLVMFEESGHSPFEDEPEKFFSTLKAFLSNLPQVRDEELSRWKNDLAERSKNPALFVNGLGWGRKSNREIASKYDKVWLDQISDSTALLKIGFALYDVKRYEEALGVFEKMQARAGVDQSDQVVPLIWQGHMLDLLGRREEAISRYRKAAGMNVEGTEQHDQFGLTYSPSSYARQRIETPFARVENRTED